MSDFLQKTIDVKMEYRIGQEKTRINMDESEENFYAKLDEIKINPKIANINNLEIKKTGVKMNFTTPIICRAESIELNSSMMAGVKFEGKGKTEFIEKIEEKAKSFGPEWERSVTKRRKEIIKRRPSRK